MEKQEENKILKGLKKGYNLPTLSPVALKLVELASDDDCSARELANFIEKDPSLAVRLLKLANSAFFQSRQPVTTLEQALIKVGFHRLRIMGLSLSLRDTFPMGKVGPMNYEKFWRSSLYRALLAKSLAQRLKSCHPEEAFVAGLILEIGLLVFYDLLILGRDVSLPENTDEFEKLLSWETEQFGINHRNVGEEALRFWKFPDSIIRSQKLYGEKALEKDASELARICEQARILGTLLLKKEHEFSSLYQEAYQTLNIDRDILDDILLETFEEVQVIADQLRLDLDGERDLLDLMEKANRALSQLTTQLPEQTSDKPPSFDPISDGHILDTQTLQAVAHEIRNPLMVVGGFARRLATKLDPSSDSGRYAKFILDETLRLETAFARMTSPESSKATGQNKARVEQK